jgi:hypothetical protein
MRYADSALTAWRLAAYEASIGGAAAIEPGHVLLGLCKLCDAGAPELAADVESLRSALTAADIEPAPFRRMLRRRLAAPGPRLAPRDLHRSDASRTLFIRAERIATAARQEQVRAVHLLTAVLADPARDALVAGWPPPTVVHEPDAP